LKLLILDRDGVINYDSDAYIKSVQEWIPLPGSIEAIAQLSKAGWTVAVATNQSGIARGYYDIATLDADLEQAAGFLELILEVALCDQAELALRRNATRAQRVAGAETGACPGQRWRGVAQQLGHRLVAGLATEFEHSRIGLPSWATRGARPELVTVAPFGHSAGQTDTASGCTRTVTAASR